MVNAPREPDSVDHGREQELGSPIGLTVYCGLIQLTRSNRSRLVRPLDPPTADLSWALARWYATGTAISYRRRMTVSFVLRFAEEPLRRGHVVGHAENVATAERDVVHDIDSLVAFICRSGKDMEEAG